MENLESDGFLYDQRRCKGMRYGWTDSSKTGCGWIACYNLLHLIGYDYSPGAVCTTMAAWLPFGGFIGTHVLPLFLWLRKHTPLRIALISNHTPVRLKSCKGGIVWYFTGKGLHFAAFSNCEHGKFHFFNAVYGAKNLRCSLPAFRKLYCPFPFVVVFYVPGRVKHR